MPVKLLNVRLNDEDARRAGELRETGVQISKIVREAIRSEHDRRIGRGRPRRDTAETLAKIYAAHPDSRGTPTRTFDLRDRKATRRAILRKLRKRRA